MFVVVKLLAQEASHCSVNKQRRTDSATPLY